MIVIVAIMILNLKHLKGVVKVVMETIHRLVVKAIIVIHVLGKVYINQIREGIVMLQIRQMDVPFECVHIFKSVETIYIVVLIISEVLGRIRNDGKLQVIN
jgi:hypothetical protein